MFCQRLIGGKGGRCGSGGLFQFIGCCSGHSNLSSSLWDCGRSAILLLRRAEIKPHEHL
jgi:hypothetical protein